MKKIFTLLFICCNLSITLFAQNVGISPSASVPNASAMLDIVASDKGLLVPRFALSDITVAAPVVSPALSLIVYNTFTSALATASNNVVPGFYYWDGAKWVAFAGSGGKDWALQGNGGTTPPSVGYGTAVNNNFLGTTDAQDLVFATNNLERMRIKSDNGSQLRIGMGTAFTVNMNTGSTPSLLHLHDWGTTSNDFAILNLSSQTTSNGDRTGVINFAATSATNERRAASIESYLTAASGTNVSGDLRFFTNNANSFTEKMRMLSNGNVGIANTAPTEKLDVTGNVRFSNALMPNNLPGASGQVLVSQGAGVAPIWKSAANLIKTFSAFATRTNVNGTAWVDVTGLTQVITTTGPAILVIMTYGSVENRGATNTGCGAEVKITQNTVDVPNAYQTLDVTNAGGVTGTIHFWSFQTTVSLPAAGTYTFQVQAHKYTSSFANFYAGGNSTAPTASQNQGSLIILEFDQ